MRAFLPWSPPFYTQPASLRGFLPPEIVGKTPALKPLGGIAGKIQQKGHLKKKITKRIDKEDKKHQWIMHITSPTLLTNTQHY